MGIAEVEQVGPSAPGKKAPRSLVRNPPRAARIPPVPERRSKQRPAATARFRLLERIADRIVSVERNHPVRVGIDGIDGAGKTTLADELVGPVRARGRAVIRSSVDRFHFPRAQRYRRGRASPVGYYQDSFDYRALWDQLLLPLGPGGNRTYRTGVFDYRSDAVARASPREAGEGDVLLFDGVFLFRPELVDGWDLKVFVAVDPAVALERAVERDPSSRSDPDRFRAHYRSRYLEGNRIYLDAVRPQELAELVVRNDDVDAPRLIDRRRPTRRHGD